MPIESQRFWGALKQRGYTFFAGVPDSTFGKAFGLLTSDPDVHYVPAVREDVALGVISAGYFAGRKGAVVMQNSGVGNIVNPLSSFSLMYKIPALLVVGWRGYGGPPNDAPEHWIMGVKTPEIFSLLDVPHAELGEDDFEDTIDKLLATIDERSVPGALLVPAGVLG